MREHIDFERKMTFHEHVLLYYYDRLVNGNATDYENWVLTEALINSYNQDERTESQERLDLLIGENVVEIERRQTIYDERPWDVEKPVIWGDRNRDEYYVSKLVNSHRFEVYAESVFRAYGLDIGLFYGREEQYQQGETRVGIEVKCDRRSVETGNYYFEFQERLNTTLDWTNSGILKEDNTRFYFYGDVGHYCIVAKEDIMEYYRRLVVEGETIPGCRVITIPRGTSKGFIVPIEKIEEIRRYPRGVAREILADLNTGH